MNSEAFLERVLHQEVHVASLLAFLTAREPKPLQQRLGLTSEILDVEVEKQVLGRSRLDVVLIGDSGPIAILELKVSATEHGDQLVRYEEFANRYKAPKYLIDLEMPGGEIPPGWKRASLADVFSCWSDSTDPTTNAFAGEITGIFARWQAQSVGPLADMAPAMYSVVLRSARAVLQQSGLEAYAIGTSAGQPSLTAFLPHPSKIDRAFLCVDVRCQDKNDSTHLWLFRIGVQVDRGDELSDDRRLAHDLAMQLEPRLTLAAIQSHIGDHSAAISGEQPLKNPKDRFSKIDRWLDEVKEAADSAVSRHPVFHHDWGRRLAAKFYLDPSTINQKDLIALVQCTLEYLRQGSIAQRDESVDRSL